MQITLFIIAAIGAIPELMRGIAYIVKRTKTKKDDVILEKVDKIKS
jgi:hypothetical protein